MCVCVCRCACVRGCVHGKSGGYAGVCTVSVCMRANVCFVVVLEVALMEHADYPRQRAGRAGWGTTWQGVLGLWVGRGGSATD